MFGMDGGWGSGMGLGMWVFWILVIVVIIVLIRMIVPRSGSSSANPDKSPIEILKARYARGEIDEEEFKRRRRDLEQ